MCPGLLSNTRRPPGITADAELGRKRNSGAAAPVLGRKLADHRLADALAVDVGGVPEVDADFESAREGAHRLALARGPVEAAEAHAAEADRRNRSVFSEAPPHAPSFANRPAIASGLAQSRRRGQALPWRVEDSIAIRFRSCSPTVASRPGRPPLLVEIDGPAVAADSSAVPPGAVVSNQRFEFASIFIAEVAMETPVWRNPLFLPLLPANPVGDSRDSSKIRRALD
jgi:hypothetical protein